MDGLRFFRAYQCLILHIFRFIHDLHLLLLNIEFVNVILIKYLLLMLLLLNFLLHFFIWDLVNEFIVLIFRVFHRFIIKLLSIIKWHFFHIEMIICNGLLNHHISFKDIVIKWVFISLVLVIHIVKLLFFFILLDEFWTL